MPGYNLNAVLSVLNLVWIFIGFESTAVRIGISKITGKDNLSCLVSNAARPCGSVTFALFATEDSRNRNETNFTFSIEDQVYDLEERVKIIQTSPYKNIILNSNHSTGSIINCTNISAGFEIGSRHDLTNKTRNISFVNLGFQNCGPRFAAAVIIWNSDEINFMNCVFKDNKQAGINGFDSGVAIDSCLFMNNTSNRQNSSEKFQDGITTAAGGAGFLFRKAVNLSIIIRNSNFTLNSAVTNRSTHFVAPSSNVSHFTSTGGGLLAVFLEKTNQCRVVIEDSIFFEQFSNLWRRGLLRQH